MASLPRQPTAITPAAAIPPIKTSLRDLSFTLLDLPEVEPTMRA